MSTKPYSRTHGRKPAHLEMVGGKSPRQRIWEKIRELKAFTQCGLIRELPGDIHPDTTRTYVKALLNGNYLEKSRLTQRDDIYHLCKDSGVEAPRLRKDGSEVTQGRAQENIWQTLRRTRHPIGARELAALATTDAIPVNFIAVRDYLLNLNNAGYLNKYEGKTFQLKPAMNTGPRPPMIQRISQVYDPNLGKVVWSQNGAEEDAANDK